MSADFTTLEELRKDAARYRFIKRNATGAGADGGSIMLYVLGPTHWDEPIGDAIDTAIDEARKRESAE